MFEITFMLIEGSNDLNSLDCYHLATYSDGLRRHYESDIASLHQITVLGSIRL